MINPWITEKRDFKRTLNQLPAWKCPESNFSRKVFQVKVVELLVPNNYEYS